MWDHTTNPSYDLNEMVDIILDLRNRRALASAKRSFDKKEIAKRGDNYDKKSGNFLGYSDMNMRYPRISGVLQCKGSGLIIVLSKHILVEKFAKSTASEESIMHEYRELYSALLPIDYIEH